MKRAQVLRRSGLAAGALAGMGLPLSACTSESADRAMSDVAPPGSLPAIGLQFAYHNHDFDFEPLNGSVPYQVLLEETDPEHVQMELDLYWVRAAGHDPLDYLQRAPDHYPLCHVKDMGADGEMVSVGEGTLDFASLFRTAPFERYFVEHDNPDDPLQSIETSYQTLVELGV